MNLHYSHLQLLIYYCLIVLISGCHGRERSSKTGWAGNRGGAGHLVGVQGRDKYAFRGASEGGEELRSDIELRSDGEHETLNGILKEAETDESVNEMLAFREHAEVAELYER